MGLALGIVLECDLIVAAAGTKFQVTETSRGLGGAKYWALLNFRGAAAIKTRAKLRSSTTRSPLYKTAPAS